jgi:hypothetical protein
MVFGDFKYPDVLTQFGLKFENADDLFAGVPPVAPSALLQEQLKITAGLASTINTEKARSEWMVAPVLAEFWSRYHGHIGLYSGVSFDAGLNGYCDYLVSRSPQQRIGCSASSFTWWGRRRFSPRPDGTRHAEQGRLSFDRSIRSCRRWRN